MRAPSSCSSWRLGGWSTPSGAASAMLRACATDDETWRSGCLDLCSGRIEWSPSVVVAPCASRRALQRSSDELCGRSCCGEGLACAHTQRNARMTVIGPLFGDLDERSSDGTRGPTHVSLQADGRPARIRHRESSVSTYRASSSSFRERRSDHCARLFSSPKFEFVRFRRQRLFVKLADHDAVVGCLQFHLVGLCSAGFSR